ncbi:MAG: hypothetical protein H7A23_26565 [Leptospiraceae bacterium]|nr:hypothetical protein [Leptospiraceae bacterium]MCP5498136.1 hypothetical protein [Leptospiraceae bacterium]
MFTHLIRWFVVFGFLLISTNCQNNSDTVSKDTANTYLLAALLQTNELQTFQNRLVELQGYWKTGYYASSTYTESGRIVVMTSPYDSGLGSWSTTTSSSSSSIDDFFYRIVEIDNANNKLYYQQGQGNNNYYASFGTDYRGKYGRIDWTNTTTSGCENSASKCFYFCEAVIGKDSLSAAKSDTTTTDSSSPTSSGCNGFGWSRALSTTDTTSW